MHRLSFFGPEIYNEINRIQAACIPLVPRWENPVRLPNEFRLDHRLMVEASFCHGPWPRTNEGNPLSACGLYREVHRGLSRNHSPAGFLSGIRL